MAAAKQLYVLINIGKDDQEKYGIPNSPQGEFPPLEGDVISVEDEALANILVNVLKCCEEHDAKRVKEHQEKVAKFDHDVMKSEVHAQVVRQQLEQEAKDELAKKQQVMSRTVETKPKPEPK